MSEFEHLLGALEPWVREYGVGAVFVTLVFESFGVPLPGESLLIVASILAGRGDIGYVALFVSAWAGSVLGDSIGYLIGRKLGSDLLRDYGGKIGLTAARIARVQAAFARYGPAAVGLARFFNVLRQLNGVVAGSLRMPWRRFLLFNALGGAAWVLVWTVVGYNIGLHGASIASLVHKFGHIGIVLALIVAATLALLSHVYRKRARPKS